MKMKKFLAALLAVAMVAAGSVVAFAANYTINPPSGAAVPAKGTGTLKLAVVEDGKEVTLDAENGPITAIVWSITVGDDLVTGQAAGATFTLTSKYEGTADKENAVTVQAALTMKTTDPGDDDEEEDETPDDVEAPTAYVATTTGTEENPIELTVTVTVKGTPEEEPDPEPKPEDPNGNKGGSTSGGGSGSLSGGGSSPVASNTEANRQAETAAMEAVEAAMEAISSGVSSASAAKVQNVATAAGTTVPAVSVKMQGVDAHLSAGSMETMADASVGLRVNLDGGAAEILIPGGFPAENDPLRIYYPVGYQKDPYYAGLMKSLVRTADAKTETYRLGGGTLPTTATVTIKSKLTGPVKVYHWNEDTRRVTLLTTATAENGKVVFATKQLGNLIITDGTI